MKRRRPEEVLTDEGNVIDGIRILEAWLIGEAAKGRNAGKDRVGLNSQSNDVSDGRQGEFLEIWKRHTCVPPSPGRVLYHKDWSGPEMAFWDCPCPAWAVAMAAQLRAKRVDSGCIVRFVLSTRFCLLEQDLQD